MAEQAINSDATMQDQQAKSTGVFGWVNDREFLVPAAEEFLVALGVDEPHAREVPRLVGLVGQAHVLRSEVDSIHDTDEANTRPVDDYTSQQRQRFNDLVGEIAPIVFPVADQGLDRLGERGIRLEIAGFAGTATTAALREVEGLYNSGQWRAMSDEALEDYFALFSNRNSACRTAPRKPTRKEVRAIVAVLRAMPHATVRRIAKFRGRLYLSIVVRILLLALRRANAADAAQQVPERKYA